MSDEQLGPIEPRKVFFPVPPVCTAQWEEKDWDTWIAKYGVRESLVLKTAMGLRHAVGRNAQGDLVYRLNTEGDVR
jgi:hypothetical protein